MKLLLKDSGKVRVIADSAIARNRQPWFLPDFGLNWRWRTAIAFRVNKLGKNVNPKFMARYIDAVTLLWVPEADEVKEADYMDGAVVCGIWLTPNFELPKEELASFTLTATIKNGDILAFMLPDSSSPIALNQHISLQYMNQEVISFNIK